MAAFSWRAGSSSRTPFTQNASRQESPFALAASAPSQSSAPNMSAYGPPAGARQNDLTASNLPYNLWGPAATNAANKAAGNSNMYQSWTMPGYAQSFNGLTGQPKSDPTPSWAGNDAYMPVGQRDGPVNWTTSGLDGQQYSGSQGWQQANTQREAFASGLIQRLGDYQSGSQSGAPTFDFQSILGRADDSLRNNTWQNPFTDPRASNPRPTMGESVYNPTPYASGPQGYGGQLPASPRAAGGGGSPNGYGSPRPSAPAGGMPNAGPGYQTPPASPTSAGGRNQYGITGGVMWDRSKGTPGYATRPPTQWTDQDWAEYKDPNNHRVMDSIGWTRGSDGRVEVGRGNPYLPAGTEDSDAMWRSQSADAKWGFGPTAQQPPQPQSPPWPTPGARQIQAPMPSSGGRFVYGPGGVMYDRSRDGMLSGIPAQAPDVRQSGFAAGWSPEIHGSGWMNNSGQYWNGTGRAPWAQ